MQYQPRQEDVEAFQRELQEQFSGPPAKPANLELALTLTDDGLLRYRARRFRVPPVSWRDGEALHALEVQLALLERETPTKENLRQRLPLIEDLVALLHRLVRPVTWWDRLSWRWRANPFLHATSAELGELLRFFFGARTTTHVSWIWSSRAPARWNTTWPPTLPNSSAPFRNGSPGTGRNGGTRSRGVTTSRVA